MDQAVTVVHEVPVVQVDHEVHVDRADAVERINLSFHIQPNPFLLGLN